ncbi:MAG: pseudouridine synthase [Myxococcota bacterium]
MSILEHVVYRDAELVVVDKPPGIVSCGPDRDGPEGPRHSVESLLVAALGVRQIWAIHQLDRETSGLNLFALKKGAVQVWAERLKLEGAKRYLALTHGVPRLGLVTAAIGERVDPATGKTFPAVVADDAPGARAASSIIMDARANADLSAALVEIRPLTGRTHQVRLHLAHLGCPVLGEKIHASPPSMAHVRHALHAWRLVFADRTFEAPLAADLRALGARFGLC